MNVSVTRDSADDIKAQDFVHENKMLRVITTVKRRRIIKRLKFLSQVSDEWQKLIIKF